MEKVKIKTSSWHYKLGFVFTLPIVAIKTEGFRETYKGRESIGFNAFLGVVLYAILVVFSCYPYYNY